MNFAEFVEGKYNITFDRNETEATLNLVNINYESVGFYLCTRKSSNISEHYLALTRIGSYNYLFVKGKLDSVDETNGY